MRIAADPDRGVRAEGEGKVRGAPVRIAFAGAAVKPGRWPFTADITGEQLVMKAVGTMDRPLDTDAMTLDLSAKADDLKRIDAVIEAGLFQTRPVQLTAHVRHERPRWTITDLKGRIGRSDLSGRLTVDKKDGRTLLDGEVTAAQLDFDDLSSAQGRAEAAALERRIGPRLVPNTRIDIGKIDTTDGTIRFRVGRVVSAQGPSPITGFTGRMTMDHQLLTIGDIRMALREGVVTGQAVIDQRNGAKVPRLSVDLRLRGASVLSLSGETRITGHVGARAKLAGVGETVRAAIGRADGRIGLVVANGTLPDRYATALGFDAGAAFMGDSGKATLRCLVLGVDLKNGTGRADPLIVDTSRSRLDGTGTVSFPDERLALRLTGAPKQGRRYGWRGGNRGRDDRKARPRHPQGGEVGRQYLQVDRPRDHRRHRAEGTECGVRCVGTAGVAVTLPTSVQPERSRRPRDSGSQAILLAGIVAWPSTSLRQYGAGNWGQFPRPSAAGPAKPQSPRPRPRPPATGTPPRTPACRRPPPPPPGAARAR